MIKILLSMLTLLFVSASVQGQKYDRYSVKPERSMRVTGKISEGSGLVANDGMLWTHNDSGEPILFALDTAATLIKQIRLRGIEVTDWEDMDQDKNYLYVGNIGNNANNRDTIQILRILKTSLTSAKPVIDSIRFSWPKSRETKHSKKKKIDYDCEAMAVIGDSIYLFTKEWKHGTRTKVFSVPAKPGFQSLSYKQQLKTSILITGASYHPATGNLALLGHNFFLRPFILLFPAANTTDLFGGPAKKIKVRIPFKQTEGIATFDGKTYYLINEKFKFLFFRSRQQLHRVNVEKP